MLFERIQFHNPDRIALVDETVSITYGDLLREITLRQEKLRDVRSLGLLIDNSADWVLWDLAALKSGIPCVPIPPFFTAQQKDHSLRAAGVSCILLPTGMQDTGFDARPLHEGTAKITFTSGTTGTPKGVCLSQSSMETVAFGILDALGSSFAGTHLSILPLGVLLENVAGVYSVLAAGGTVRLDSLMAFGKNYDFLHDRLLAERITSAIVVPEILRILMAQVQEKGPLPDLKFIAVGGAKIDPGLIVQARFLGLPVYEGYGLSECASVIAMNTPSSDRPGTVGKFLSHVNAELSSNGEVIIHSPGFLGYVGQAAPENFATGDLGHLEDGFLSITGRAKNVLITSYGRNISPEWVEAALTAQPEIAQSFVYGDGLPSLEALIVPVNDQVDIGAALYRANETLPEYAQVKLGAIVEPFTPAQGLLTGNGRLRRDTIYNYYRQIIEKEKNHGLLRHAG